MGSVPLCGKKKALTITLYLRLIEVSALSEYFGFLK